MAALGGKVVMGEVPPLVPEIEAFGKAVSGGNPNEIEEARKALRDAAGNEHAGLDAAAVVGFFASITKIVDFSGHYDLELSKMMQKMEKVLGGARTVRMFLTAPFRWIGSMFKTAPREY